MVTSRNLSILIQKVLQASGALEVMFTEIQLDTVTHQNGVSPLLEELHKGPSNWQGHQSKDNRHEDRRLDLASIWFDAGNEDVAYNSAESHDEGDADVDEEFGGSMADEELSAASKDQVERLLS